MKHFSNQQLEQLEPNYLNRYGLDEAPFAPQHDDRFLFLDADRAQRLNMLHHLTQYSDLLLIINGEKGIGKTSLLQRFTLLADEDWQICKIEANALMDSTQFLQLVTDGFALDSSSPNHDHNQLFIENLSELKHTGVIPILVIDDAHELPVDTLEKIFELADTKLDDHSLLRIILFADPIIDVTLKSSPIDHLLERVTHTMELLPLTEQQTEQYIYHRFNVAGLTGENPIDQKILRKIYRGSDGVPAQINRLTHLTLQDGVENVNNDALFTESNYHFPTRRYLISGSIAAIIIGLILTIQNALNTLFDDSEQIVLSLPIENRISSKQTESADDHSLATDADPQLKTESQSNDKPKTQNKPITTASNTSSGKKTGIEVKEVAVKEIGIKEIAVKKVAIKKVDNSVKQAKTDEIMQASKVKRHQERIILLNKTKPESDSLDTTIRENSNPSDLNYAKLSQDNNSIEFQDQYNTTPETANNSTSAKPGNNKTTRANQLAPKVYEITPKKIIASKTPQVISIVGEGFSQRSFITLTWSGKSKRLSTRQVKVINDKLIEISITTGLKPEVWALTITHPKYGKSKRASFHVSSIKQAIRDTIASSTKLKQPNPAVSKPSTKVSKNPSNIQDIKWILSQDSTRYTMQLLGAKSKKDIFQFVKKKKIKGQYAMYTSIRNGEIWYHLIMGAYSDKITALNVVKAIPRKIGIGKPWIRPMLDVQNAIKRQKENRAITKLYSPPPPKIKPFKYQPTVAISVPTSVKEQSSWLWGQSPTHYTLQLLGTRTESNIKKFVMQHKLQGKAIYFNVKRQGKDWFSLVYGVYPTIKSAINARNSLSKSLRKAKPWPRNFASIHKELDNNP